MSPFNLETIDGKLCLTDSESSKLKPFFIDFTSGAVDFRRKSATGKAHLIIKAVGGRNLKILDLTAGLARDAFVLAGAGNTVVALERVPRLFALLQDGAQRAAEKSDFFKKLFSEKLVFKLCEARDFLSTTQEEFDVIYFDPMFTEAKGSALPKKEMQILYRLLESTTPKNVEQNEKESIELLQLARKKCRRVVVKRALLAPPIDGKPNQVFKGKSVRFDVYFLTNLLL